MNFLIIIIIILMIVVIIILIIILLLGIITVITITAIIPTRTVITIHIYPHHRNGILDPNVSQLCQAIATEAGNVSI